RSGGMRLFPDLIVCPGVFSGESRGGLLLSLALPVSTLGPRDRRRIRSLSHETKTQMGARRRVRLPSPPFSLPPPEGHSLGRAVFSRRRVCPHRDSLLRRMRP